MTGIFIGKRHRINTPKGDIDHEEYRMCWIWGSSWSLNEGNGEDSAVDVSLLKEFAAIPPEKRPGQPSSQNSKYLWKNWEINILTCQSQGKRLYKLQSCSARAWGL